jgi:hypothetical protein
MLAGAMTTMLVAVPAAALAHIERTGYWPDPAPDTARTPAAGGEVPTERSLAWFGQGGSSLSLPYGRERLDPSGTL